MATIKYTIFLLPIFLTFFVSVKHGYAALYIDDTSTTAKKHFSAEFYIDYYRDEEEAYNPETEIYDLNVSKDTYLSLDLSYGLLDNCDITVTGPYEFISASSGDEAKKSSGFSDIYLSTKYRFWDERKILPSFAMTFDFKSDSANDDKDLGTGKKDYSINNILTKNFGKNSFDLNLGYIFVGGKAGDLVFYIADWERELFKNTSICMELYGEHNFEGSPRKKVFCAATSLSYQLNNMINIETGVGVGLTKASPDYQFSGSIAFDF